MRRNTRIASVAVAACALCAGGVGVVQAQDVGEGPADLPLGFTIQPLAGERTIDLDDVPPEVLQTADQAADSTDLRRAQVDFDDIEVVYEITGRTKAGKSIEFDVRPDGVLEEIEEVIVARDVPKEATTLLNQTFPGFRITNRERSTRPTRIGLLRVFYEFDGRTRDGRDLDVEINQRGTVITVEPASRQQPAPGTEVPTDGGGDGPGGAGGGGGGAGGGGAG